MSDSSEEENEEMSVLDKVASLKVNRDNLNKALNGHCRSIIKEIASENILFLFQLHFALVYQNHQKKKFL